MWTVAMSILTGLIGLEWRSRRDWSVFGKVSEMLNFRSEIGRRV